MKVLAPHINSYYRNKEICLRLNGATGKMVLIQINNSSARAPKTLQNNGCKGSGKARLWPCSERSNTANKPAKTQVKQRIITIAVDGAKTIDIIAAYLSRHRSTSA